MLIKSLDVSAREELAKWATPEWILESEFIQNVLARDPSVRVRAGLAGADVSDALRRSLIDEADDDEESLLESVVSTVARCTRDPGIAADLVGRKRAWQNLVYNPVTPANVLEEVFQRTSWYRSGLAQHSNTAPRLLAKIAETTPDSDTETRTRLAKHPHTDPDVLSALARDETPAIRQAIAGHPNTPTTLLAKLAADTDSVVRAIVAMNRKTLAPTLEQLATDSDLRVRQLVASNPRSSERVWTLLAVDRDPTVSALAHRHLTPSAESRRQLASQPGTEPELLQLLAADDDLEVRLAVARRGDVPPTLS